MPFQPATRLLKFARGAQLEAWAALNAIQPDEPFTDLRHAYPLDADLPFRDALDQTPLACGPVAPIAACPVTGRALKLHAFRDLTALILRETAHGSLEVLPAVLVLPSSSLGEGFKDVPFHDRGAIVPSLQLQARSGGIFFEVTNTEADTNEISRLLADAMVEVAAEVLAAPPVADPRAHLDPPAGARFAPHAKFPEVDHHNARLARFNKTLAALGNLRAAQDETLFYGIEVYRELPGEPWRERSRGGPAGFSHNYRSRARATRDRDLDKLIRRLLDDPELAPPLCYRHGPERLHLLRLRELKAPSSNHEAMVHHQALRDLAERYDITPLFAERKGAA